MLTPKLKLYLLLGLTSASILPNLGFYAANKYIEGYSYLSGYIAKTKAESLQYIGLESIKLEKPISSLISEHSKTYNLNPALLSALITQESAGNENAYSPKSAIGLTQIMPFNAKRCGLSSPSKLWDTSNNIKCGAQILSEELKNYKGNIRSALEAYNGGSRAVGHFPDSKAYANRVIEVFAQNLAKS